MTKQEIKELRESVIGLKHELSQLEASIRRVLLDDIDASKEMCEEIALLGEGEDEASLFRFMTQCAVCTVIRHLISAYEERLQEADG